MSAAGADQLIRTFEDDRARALGRGGRREAGLYYTPPEVAARVVELALRFSPATGIVLDPCAGAGAFLVAAARAGARKLRGIDLDPAALRVAQKALRLCGVVPRLQRADALRFAFREPADLLVSNPPYGHVADAAEREALLRALPALCGGEIDRYAAFLLRALELVRPGGVAALLVPDTWMFLSRAGPLREEILRRAEIAALVDLGKPFSAAKDTRVHAAVLRRKPLAARSRGKARVPGHAFVARGREELAPVAQEELLASARRGWFVYRTQAEQALCAAMESASVPLGSVCAVGYGLRTGDNPRHVARRPPARGELGVVGGEDIVPYGLRWREKALVDAARFLPLVERQHGRRRVAIQRIRTNARAPWARWLEAALVPAHLVCLDSLSTLAAPDELLWALLALVSSAPLNRLHRLRTTDVNVKPSALRELPVPRRLLAQPASLAGLARERAAAAGAAAAHALDRRIDARVYQLFGLSRRLVEASERGFWEDRYPEEFQRLEQAMSDPPRTVARKEGTA